MGKCPCGKNKGKLVPQTTNCTAKKFHNTETQGAYRENCLLTGIESGQQVCDKASMSLSTIFRKIQKLPEI